MNIQENALALINEYRSKLLQHEIDVTEVIKRDYNYEFITNDNSDKVKIQVYFGKKGVRTVLQGNNETRLYNNIESVIFQQTTFSFKEKEPAVFEEYIGSDETGKGDVFGPLIVCAYYYDASQEYLFNQLGVRDSKELSKDQISNTAVNLLEHYKNNAEIISIKPETYNDLYGRFNNLNKLLNWAHSTAISNLLLRFDTKNIIVDKFSNEKLQIKTGDESLNIKMVHKAESNYGVAAASIIARFYFDQWFENQKKYVLQKGASEITVKLAQKIFDDKGLNELAKLAKLHFKSIKSIIDR